MSKEPKALYNPMTGARLDLEVTPADSPEAGARIAAAWDQKRARYLERILKDCSETARPIYERELARLRAGS